MSIASTWLIFSDATSNFIDSSNKLNPLLPTPSKNIILTSEFSRSNNDAALNTITTAGYSAGYSAAINNYLTNSSASWKVPTTAYSGTNIEIAQSIVGTSANPGTLLYPDAEAKGFSNNIYLTPDYEYDCKGPNGKGADGYYGYLQTLLTSWALRVLNPNNPIVPVIGQNVASGNSGTFNASQLQSAAQKILPSTILDDFDFTQKTFPELLFNSKVNNISPLINSVSVENYAQNKNNSTAAAPAGNPGFPVDTVPYSVVTDYANSDKTTFQTKLPNTSNYGPASNQESLNIPDGSIYIGDGTFQWSTLSTTAINNIDVQNATGLKSSTQNLVPEAWLMHYGLPNGFIATEQQFEELCNDLIEFISNTGIKKVYFEIGDYKTIKQYNYCDPSILATGTNNPWIVNYLLNKLPSQVEVGAVVSMTPKYPWQIDPNNTANNTTIGDGTAGQPKDNARQAFELIQTINKFSPSKLITSFHFDHEGGGEYQNDNNYGGTNGQPIGAGYLKWLWNQFMPSSVIFSDSLASSSTFKGHYNFGWINYKTTAWLNNSSGSIDAFSENYWFGENEDYPGNYALDPTLTPNLSLAERLGLNLKSFIDVFGKDPSKYPSTIAGGANLINWSRTVDPITGQPSSATNAVPTLNENAIYTVYRMYKDNPKALAEIFNNKNYSFINSGGLPAFSDSYYAPIDITQANNNPNSPQGGIPTVSLENLSSSNQSQQAVIDAGLANRFPSLTSQFTVANDKLNPNTTGGSFDGLSALSYDNFITFLNTSAGILSTAGITPGQPGRDPSSTRIALYELQFIPLDWTTQQVANNHPYLIRFHDPITGRHHYTHNVAEATTLESQGWQREGRKISLLNSGSADDQLMDVWRLFQASTGDHLLTTSETEINHAKQIGYVSEGKIGAVSSSAISGLNPVYRFYNPQKHAHFYTDEASEASSLGNLGYVQEGFLGWC